mmetsp:Transcript_20315/g.56500  ORF Transcript_20315/g.56500 Transcript_20315/m.56500 type:complete len:174 (+) Transcript_20315:146-667(+)
MYGMICTPSRKWQNESTFYMQCKCMMYMVWSAGDDVDTQRRGIIYLGWFDPSFNPKFRFDLKMGIIRLNYTRIMTVRASAIHICFPDRPVYRFFRKLIMVQGSQPNRPKMTFHLGKHYRNRMVKVGTVKSRRRIDLIDLSLPVFFFLLFLGETPSPNDSYQSISQWNLFLSID